MPFLLVGCSLQPVRTVNKASIDIQNRDVVDFNITANNPPANTLEDKPNQTYTDGVHGYSFSYPLTFEVVTLSGEGVPLGKRVHILDSEATRGSYQEIAFNVYENGWIPGDDLDQPVLFNFTDDLENIEDVHNSALFEKSELFTVNNIRALRLIRPSGTEGVNLVYIVLEDPVQPGTFIVFHGVESVASRLIEETLETVEFFEPTLARYEWHDSENQIRFTYPLNWILEKSDPVSEALGPLVTVREPIEGGLEFTIFVDFNGGFECSVVESEREITLSTKQTLMLDITTTSPECNSAAESITERGLLVHLPTELGNVGTTGGDDLIIGHFDYAITPDGVDRFDEILSSLELLDL